VAATSACDSLHARGNYFGQNAGVIEGKVDTTGALTSSPARAIVATGPAPPGPAPVRLLGAFPNPTRGSIRLELESDRAGTMVDLDLHDIAGRLVRRYAGSSLTSGRNILEWDGKDEAGGRVANGIYLARVRSQNTLFGSLRIVVVR
jgi:flagellar hook assembly protein FlgD